MNPVSSDPLDRYRFPLDEWALTESQFDAGDQGHTETLFAVGNGYLGMRGIAEEGYGGYSNGTFINGYHDTWAIRHAEEAYGFARVGQTIVNVPDAKLIRLYVDDEPFILAEADCVSYERRLDFQNGVLARELVWRAPSGKRVLIRSRRLTSFTDRHLAVVEYEVTMLDADASIVLSSQILNRQDWVDEYAAAAASEHPIDDPRRAAAFSDRVLQPRFKSAHDGRFILGYRAANSGMTLAVGAQHALETQNEWSEHSEIDDDLAKQVYSITAQAGVPIRLVKTIAYHTSKAVPTRGLADRCDRTLDRIAASPIEDVFDRQREWLDAFWQRSDVRVPGQPAIQQATRWNIFQLAQATARTDGGGIAAKGVSGSGYGGHYFWDTEIYVLPFLTYTSPQVARNALRFRHGMLDLARERARELNQRGALFPWRTINGLEAGAYYAAGTAQYHIDADISHALSQYVSATGDVDFLIAGGAIDILVETARMWADLGFWRGHENRSFHIHGVTGPDEYTTVVNDNLFTNVMARANLRAAVRRLRAVQQTDPEEFERLALRLELREDEIVEWAAAGEAMHILFDEELGIHPQDSQFLEKELWDLENTPPSQHPLLLHYHPLVIYRFQVIKQADVVLALLLQGDEFTEEEKRKNFEYYDALTTGDSTLSASTQSIVAAEVGYRDLALEYFTTALFVDLGDLHHNSADGVHVASTGGVWSALVFGFGGMRDYLGTFTFDPRLPEEWETLEFNVTILGARLHVTVCADVMTFEIEEGESVLVYVREKRVQVVAGSVSTVKLVDDGPVLEGAPTTSDIEGSLRADGSVITATIPTLDEDFVSDAVAYD
ncbi:glycoside hydrolase family 65 protein [Subtercola endophyticus]|uniref:glycoside hydrolase family 65 protein n=1 Tax=Subtercola endophyticus TaxID=2895559 RepID=UPI001E2BE19B|nr:glycosyl hydrolase family 65 protein [Subtercola endophyticus]UFS59628.1 glycoside hydrolase family 65 protein [Subtercola endophyticus]